MTPAEFDLEIKINGVVVGRVYNSGVTELHDEYGSLGQQLGFGGPGEAGLEGPQLADYRIAQLKDALKSSNVEITTMSTAMTQAGWLASQISGSGHVIAQRNPSRCEPISGCRFALIGGIEVWPRVLERQCNKTWLERYPDDQCMEG